MIRRLFVAAEIPPASQARLYAAAALLRERAAQARVTRRENFHITLAFLGETDREADIRRAMDETRVPAFSLSIRGAGRFTGRGGELWWAGVDPCPALHILYQRLWAALERAGFAPEQRPFKPHLTLARGVSGAQGADARALGLSAPEPVFVGHITLFESAYRDGRLRYLPRYRRVLSEPGGGV